MWVSNDLMAGAVDSLDRSHSLTVLSAEAEASIDRCDLFHDRPRTAST